MLSVWQSQQLQAYISHQLAIPEGRAYSSPVGSLKVLGLTLMTPNWVICPDLNQLLWQEKGEEVVVGYFHWPGSRSHAQSPKGKSGHRCWLGKRTDITQRPLGLKSWTQDQRPNPDLAIRIANFLAIQVLMLPIYKWDYHTH